jgi:hypothetical protein
MASGAQVRRCVQTFGAHACTTLVVGKDLMGERECAR